MVKPHSAKELINRVGNPDRKLAWLVGAPLSTTYGPPPQGVPDVSQILKVIETVAAEHGLGDDVGRAMADASEHAAQKYQAGLHSLVGNAGQKVVNTVVRRAVLQARRPEAPSEFEGDGVAQDWHIPRGVRALARLLVHGPLHMRGRVLTTNFDPLLSLAVDDEGGAARRRVLAADGALPSPAEMRSDEQLIVHLHGYWREGGTMHQPSQLSAPRPALGGALRRLLEKHTVIVAAYGGWDDVFMKALEAVAADPGAEVEILWPFFDGPEVYESRNAHVFARVPNLVASGHFQAYAGIDAHAVFQQMADRYAAGSDSGVSSEAEVPALSAPRIAPNLDEVVPGDYVPGRAAFVVPARPPGEMVGGAAHISRVRDALRSRPAIAIGHAAAFVGLGGLGKTRLAIEFAHSNRDDYAGGVYWVEADQSLDGQMIRLGKAAGWVSPSSDDANALLVVRRLAWPKLRRALIIFDNVEDRDALDAWMPAAEQACSVILTSRHEQPDCAPVALSLLDEVEGVALLRQTAGREWDAEADAAARRIHHRLEGLPLALELVGAYLRRRSAATWSGVADRIESRGVRAPDLDGSGFHRVSLTGHSGNLLAALTLDEGLLTEHPDLAAGLEVLAFAAPAPMSLELLAVLAVPEDADRLESDLELAAELRIIQFESAPRAGSAGQSLGVVTSPRRVRMHRLVQEVHRTRTPADALLRPRAEVLSRLADWFERRADEWLFDLDPYDDQDAHLVSAAHEANLLGQHLPQARAELMLGSQGFIRGEYRTALETVRRVNERLVSSRESVAASLRIRGLLYEGILRRVCGHFADARRCLAAAGALVATAPKDTPPASGRRASEIALELGRVEDDQGNHDGAVRWGQESLRRARADTTTTAAWRLRIEANLAADLAKAGRHKDAAALIRGAVDTARGLVGPAHGLVGLVLNSVGICESRAGHGPEALSAYREALALQTATDGPDHPETAMVRANLGSAEVNFGDLTAGMGHIDSALAVRVAVLGATHPRCVELRIARVLLPARRFKLKPPAAWNELKAILATLPPGHPSRSKAQQALTEMTPPGFRRPPKPPAKKSNRNPPKKH